MNTATLAAYVNPDDVIGSLIIFCILNLLLVYVIIRIAVSHGVSKRQQLINSRAQVELTRRVA